MNKTLLVGAVSVVALVLSGVAYFRPPTIETKTESQLVAPTYGSVVASELTGPLVQIKQRFNTGTTTPCSIDLRGYASSTIVSLGASIRGVPTTTGNYWAWYKSVTPNSSTTQLARRAVTATGTSVFATTTLATDTAVIGSGDNYLVLDFNGGSSPYLDINGQTGECTALLLSPSTN
mgnify:CR=1 FL=1